jgi:DHA1 family inner membrane transport protein
MSLSYVIGVPAGAWIGSHHGWQAAIGTGAVATVLLGAVIAFAVPADLQAPAPGLRGLGEVLRDGEVISVLATTLLYFVAIFAVFSYIGAVLGALVPMTPGKLSLTLALFGVSGVAGTLLGGVANDRFGPRRTMSVLLPTLALMMALLPLTAGHPGLMLTVLMAWGAAGFGLMAPQQSRLATRAPQHASLLLSLNTTMLYAGTALGAVVGGLAIGPLGAGRLGWAAAPFALAACLLLWAGGRRRAA